MKFSEEEFKKILKNQNITMIKDILKTMCDYRINEYTSAQFASVFCSDIFSFEQSLIHTGYCLSKIIPFVVSEWGFAYKSESDIEHYIKSTYEYKKMNTLYEEYVTAISKLIKEFGNLDIYEIGILYTFLLKNGFLSENKSFEYRDLKNDNLIIEDILGARITSGFGVCRHEASNLMDVYNKLNYKAEHITCKAGLHDSVFKNHPTLFSLLKRVSHAMVGVKNDNEYLVFDPTWETFGNLSKNNKNIIETKRFCDEINNILYYINIKDDNKKFYEEFTNSPCYLDKHSFEETIEKFKEIKNKVIFNEQDLWEWHSFHVELMEEISSLEKLLCGYKEDELPKLAIIRK